MRRPRLNCVAAVLVVVALSLSMTSCGGGGGSGGGSDLVLLGFNLPNLAGIPLNNPLIFTFSANVNPLSITPDTLRVVGAIGPFFETTVVDGNLVALNPDIPNFDDYSDAGLAPGTTYTVSFPVFPAPSTIETPDGKPLLLADNFTFVTLPAPVFIEHRRPIQHGLPPSLGGRSDDEGCLQNADNALYTPPGVVQTGSGPGATLLCLMNEGAPRIIEAASSPRHDQRAVGTPSAVSPGLVELPPITIRLNEALDPLTVTPYNTSTQFPVNIQLLRVAQKDETPLVPPEEIQTNQPLIVQSLDSVEIILGAAGAVQQGIYAVNVTPNIRDLAQNQLRIDDDPNAAATGYGAFDSNIALPGWRLYFRTLELPATALAINETYANNNREHGNLGSLASEPGLFTFTSTPDPLGGAIDDPLLDPFPGVTLPAPNSSLVFNATQCGQSTSANWNNGAGTGYRMLNLPGLAANSDVTGGADQLKAVWKPWCGSGEDIDIDTRVLGSVSIDVTNTGSVDGDGIYEVNEIYIDVGDTVSAAGDKPLVIFCRGDCTILGTIDLSGSDGGPGLDTDGTTNYTNVGAISAGGAPGAAGPGGGAGGAGSNPVSGVGGGVGFNGQLPTTVHATNTDLFSGVNIASGGAFDSVDNTGGGGGGFASTGGNGVNAANDTIVTGGDQFGTTTFNKPAAEFQPDRGYLPFSNVSGGMGGSGGGARDANANTTAENGDHGGGGGGGAGGGIWLIVCGDVTIGSTAVINCSGGAGGDTFAIADQLINPGDDNAVGGGDDFVEGISGLASPSGQGGPGGGGSGGSVCIIGRGSVDVQGTATIDVRGGASPPTLAQGLTDWETDITQIDGKRYIRWRFRFFVADGFPGFGITGAPMPAILDITIPYTN